VVDLISGLRAQDVRANLARVHDVIADAGRDPTSVEILAAVKYLPAEELPALAEGGVTVVGENRSQELVAKQQAMGAAPGGDRFTWDFIGALQSRKVKDLVGRVRWIHSVATDSVLTQLGRHGGTATEVLIEVNVAGDPDKSGVAPSELDAFIERCPATVVGLMTMPPRAADPEASRPHFAALARLAAERGLPQLSMGTSQDYGVAVQEGATIIRLGDTLLRTA
jgi:uncharacterized pyridoxal phosphate-containing UPF0001 family protein